MGTANKEPSTYRNADLYVYAQHVAMSEMFMLNMTFSEIKMAFTNVTII